MRPVSLLLVLLLASPVSAQPTLIEQGREALLRDDAGAAASLFRRAVVESPEKADAHYWLGVAYGRGARKANVFRQLRLATKTRDEFELAVKLDPNQLRARYALVEFYTLAPIFLGGGDWKAFRQAAEITARNPAMGHEARAFILADEKRYAEAVAELEETVRIDPASMPAWFEIGHIAAVTGTNQNRGEEALRKYLMYTPRPEDDDPPLARAFYWLGVIDKKRGRWDKARQSWAESLRLDPTQTDARNAMASLR